MYHLKQLTIISDLFFDVYVNIGHINHTILIMCVIMLLLFDCLFNTYKYLTNTPLTTRWNDTIVYKTYRVPFFQLGVNKNQTLTTYIS